VQKTRKKLCTQKISTPNSEKHIVRCLIQGLPKKKLEQWGNGLGNRQEVALAKTSRLPTQKPFFPHDSTMAFSIVLINKIPSPFIIVQGFPKIIFLTFRELLV
jgi:hypothetical protein